MKASFSILTTSVLLHRFIALDIPAEQVREFTGIVLLLAFLLVLVATKLAS